jgi:hypothetical protein
MVACRPAYAYCLVGTGAAAAQRIATFRCDVTPLASGQPLIWVEPVTAVLSPLSAKGVVIENGGRRYVLCALDWCGVCGSTYELFRKKLAAATGAHRSQVFLHNVHQHTAPYIDGDAYALMRKAGNPPLLASDGFLDDVSNRLAQSAKEATARLQPFDRIGTGEGRVERVASARRVFVEGGKLVTRYSGGGKDPKIAALPEGDIDTILKTITFANGEKPIARLHYYATHPQTFCCDGRVSSDFVGAAREAFEREEGVFQVYFTGCSGDVTVGKYNDGSGAAREGLAERLL